jgi:hypothetical protein
LHIPECQRRFEQLWISLPIAKAVVQQQMSKNAGVRVERATDHLKKYADVLKLLVVNDASVALVVRFEGDVTNVQDAAYHVQDTHLHKASMRRNPAAATEAEAERLSPLLRR